MDTALAIGFGYYAQALNQDGVTRGLKCAPPLDFLNVSETEWRRFLELFAQTPDELASSSAAGHQSWNMVAIQSKPLLRLGDDVVVLDQQYLVGAGYWSRATRPGHIHEAGRRGDLV
jgi:hypothetical protein